VHATNAAANNKRPDNSKKLERLVTSDRNVGFVLYNFQYVPHSCTPAVGNLADWNNLRS
jgi:hypothetical protein